MKRAMSLILIAATLLLTLQPAIAQSKDTRTLKRVVITVMKPNREGILGATVNIQDTESGKQIPGTTDKNGVAEIWVSAGHKRITATADGYYSASETPTISADYQVELTLAKR